MTPGGFWFGFGLVAGLLLHPWLAHFVNAVKQRWVKLEAARYERYERQGDPDDPGRR